MSNCCRMHNARSVRRVAVACGIIHAVYAAHYLKDALAVVSFQTVPFYRQRGGTYHGLIGFDLNVPPIERIHTVSLYLYRSDCTRRVCTLVA